MWLLLALMLFVSSTLYTLSNKKAYAAQITARSLTLENGTTDGGSKPGGTVKHLFALTIPSSTNIGSIQFLYCTTASGTCNTPTGLDTTGATLTAQTGVTGFSIDTADVNGSPYITRAAVAGTGAATYELSNVVNPTAANQTFYVRISTFASTNITGGTTDTGVVAASTASQIILTGYMPESLVFCAGGTISDGAGSLADCSTATSGSITFPDFSPTAPSFITSQMAASTNGDGGYSITVYGDTMTSGSNTIADIGNTAEASQPGKINGQFGLNLVNNATPDVGIDVDDAPNGTNFRGQAKSPFATADQFAFTANSVQQVAASDNGSAGPTDIQRFTVSYLVNVSGGQPVGTYTTTLTYVCTPTF